MYDLATFSITDMVKLGKELRNMGRDTTNMEEASNNIIQHLFNQLADKETGEKSCVLARFFKTHNFENLGTDLQEFASAILPEVSALNDCKCFTLLSTAGIEDDWNFRRKSNGHQAIPLPSPEVVEKIPMMRNMLKQMGLDVNTVLHPDPRLLSDLSQTTFNVFYVPAAVDSPFIPTQEVFIKPYGVKSVIGFGAVLPSGDIFVIILFSRTSIPQQTVDLFKPLALNVKMAVLPFVKAVFAPN
jgi:hypothetical protein